MIVLEYIEKLDSNNMEIHLPSEEILYEEVKKPVLVMSHELTLTGAPIQLLFLIKALIELEYQPFLLTAIGGELLEETLENNVIVIDAMGKPITAEWIDRIPSLFRMVFANTLLLQPYVSYLAPKVERIYWWIHENSYLYNKEQGTEYVKDPSVYMLAASKQTDRNMTKYLHKSDNILTVCVKDAGYTEKVLSNRRSFMWAGSLDFNKAVDVFLNAILSMPQNVMLNSDFYIVGKTSVINEYSKLVELFVEKLPNIHFIDKLQHDDLLNFMDNMDAVVVSSLEETTSMVAVEGLMKKKIVICSDTCGVSDYLQDGKNAFVFTSKNYDDLAKKMTLVAEGEEFDQLRASAREVYENVYRYDNFVNSLSQLLSNTSL